MNRYRNGVKIMDRKEFQKHVRKSKYIAGPKSEDYYIPVRLTKTTYTKNMDKVEKSKPVKTYKLKSLELHNLGMNNLVPPDTLISCTGESKVIPFNDMSNSSSNNTYLKWDDIYDENNNLKS